MDRTTERISKLSQHLKEESQGGCPFSAGAKGQQCPFSVGDATQVKPLEVGAAMYSATDVQEAVLPPVVKATKELSTDPINFLLKCKQQHPDIFIIDRGNGYQYAVPSDVSMFEDVLTYDQEFGNPVTENMRVNKNIFMIPEEQLDRHEQNAIKGLRKYLINHNDKLADVVGKNAITYMREQLGDSGTMDLRDLGGLIFWPMNQALLGDRANYRENSFLLPAFENIDNYFGKALKGKIVPEVREGVTQAYTLFADMVQKSKQGKEKVGPVMEFYDEVTEHEDPNLTAKLCTAAYWGSNGNSLPSTVWTFGMVLSNPEVKKKAYAEADEFCKTQPDASGHYDYSKLPYLTAALKETLRLKTYSIAWRAAQNDTILKAKSGKKYKLPKGMLVGLHFAMRHFDPTVHTDPEVFEPERFVGVGSGLSPTINGHPYAWVPFSAGRHRCSGYALAMLEIPLVMALFLHEYDAEVLDPLPGLDFQQAFGVIGPDAKPVRIRYQRRTKQ